MKMACFVCVVAGMLCPWLPPLARGDDQNTVPEAVTVAKNGNAGDKDLLLFFEEQELTTATKRPTTIRNAPAIATVIAAQEIRDMGARNLLDILRMVPGLGVSNASYTLYFDVRGIYSVNQKILFMIDGHPMNRNFYGNAMFNNAIARLPVENIRQVEVVLGPGSALYGNSAFLATINVITRSAEEINGVEVKAGGGSFETYQANLTGGKSFGDKLNASFSLDQYKTNGPGLIVGADALTVDDIANGTHYSAAPGPVDMSARQTSAFIKAAYGDLSFRGYYQTHKQGQYMGNVLNNLTHDSYAFNETYFAELEYAMPIRKGLSARLKISYDEAKFNDENTKIFPDGYMGLWPQGAIYRMPISDRTMASELQVDWDVFAGNHLIAGLAFEEMNQYGVEYWANFNPTTFAPLNSIQPVTPNWNRNATRQVWATYLQDEWKLPHQMTLTTGVRYDHYSDFGDTVNPRVGLVWSFLDNADLKFLYGRAFRAPSFLELYSNTILVFYGDTSLKPEKIETYEGSVGCYFNRYFNANLSYFHSTITDQISYYLDPNHRWTYINSGKSVTQGWQLGLYGALGKNLTWKTNYTYQDPRDADTGKRLPITPTHKASGSFNYLMNKFVNLHTDVIWTGPRPREAGDPRPEMADNTTVDLAVTFKNFFKTLEVQTAIHNLFDRRSSDPAYSPAVPGDYPREGISAFVTALYKF